MAAGDISLSDVLGNQILEVEFRKWAEEAYCSENLSFYDAVRHLKKESDPDRRRARIFEIRDDFIVQDAPSQVNIDETHRERTLEQIKLEPTPDVFNLALGDVQALMETDMLPKFLRQREGLHGPLNGADLPACFAPPGRF